MAFTQSNRYSRISTPLGEDKLLVTSFSGREEMSRLFVYQLELLSEDSNIQPNQLIGKAVTVSLNPDGGAKPRYFHGHVVRFSAGMRDSVTGVRAYRAEIVPWLWFLTRNANCLVFQNKSVPDIIKDIFQRRGFSDFKLQVEEGAHPKWDYCVQYRETDFNFVSRLMEQEGIYYYFKHEDGKHTMVIADQQSSYFDCEPSSLRYIGSTSASQVFDDITSWEHQFEFRTGKWAHRDYDFTKPTADMTTSATMSKPFSTETQYEYYDYPQEYPIDDNMVPAKSSYGTGMTGRRKEEEEGPQDRVVAQGQVIMMGPGARFSLKDHIDPSEVGKSYVCTSVEHMVHEPAAYQSGQTYGGRVYTNSFSCIPSDKTFRPERSTAKPVVQGTQTAIVVGPKGQEIYTDEYGRVKVQFHWDREGKKDENSSAFIRVAQVWAGKRWGATFIPRLGQEVVVSFLEGDPDRPLIIGSVYNGDQRPPYLGNGLDSKHPDEKNISGIKTNSTLGGQGYNELRFNDTKDKEQIYIHAQKDYDTRVRNDNRERIYGNRHSIIGWEKDGNKAGDWRTKVYGNRQAHTMKNHVEHVEGNYELKVAGEEGGNLDLFVEKKRTESVGEDAHLTVTGNQVEAVNKSYSLTVAQNDQRKIGQKHAVEAGQEIHIKSGMKLIIEAGMQVSIKGPGGFIDIGPAGVTIQGIMVKINSGGAAGSGSGSSPDKPDAAKQAAPEDPAMADESKSGIKSAYS